MMDQSDYVRILSILEQIEYKINLLTKLLEIDYERKKSTNNLSQSRF